ncbi:hypothetical protein GW17_00050300 [Ensete ventricosum]|nr:hypothetical protein GW17_00050300 [Ensete ventricosum]
MIGAVGELDYFSAHIRLRELNKSEDKAESTDREGRDADARQRIVGLWAWQHHGTIEARLPSFLSSERSARTNKDHYNSANPTPDSIIGELKQHGGSEFDYSTTAAESGWEPKGRVAAKVED